MGRPHLAAAVPGVVQTIQEVVGATTGALGDDDGLGAVLVDDLAHLGFDQIERLVPRNALPLVLAAVLGMRLVDAPGLALHGVLQAIGMRVDLLGGERLHAQDAVVHRVVLVAFDSHDLVVVVNREDNAAFRVAVEARGADFSLHDLPPSFSLVLAFPPLLLPATGSGFMPPLGSDAASEFSDPSDKQPIG